eukprot:TRINITY_DN5120_c0_g4_i1.p1 TRINITY_DN5120_c0_g4~~TRINITY_DN5120_c0_g4_i1.p1  ORF type:complete len:249 (+),score=52.43 TRINITY_DN5120_c0_g4_i1:148-894(+)
MMDALHDSASTRGRATTALKCEIRNLNGGILTLDVSRAWKVWKLWNEIEEALGIPEYEQQLACGSVHLRAEMALEDLLSTHASDRLELMLARTPTPECFDSISAKWIWNAFLSLSDDGGGTVSTCHVNQLMQYAGMYRSSKQFRASDGAPSKLTFPDLLSLMAEWKGSVEPRPASEEDLVREFELLDADNTGFVSRRDFNRVTARVLSGGEGDNDDSDDSEDGDANENVEWRTELREIFSETADDFLW